MKTASLVQTNPVRHNENRNHASRVHEDDVLRTSIDGIAHDLLNLLAVINSNDELILRKADPASTIYQHAAAIHGATQRAAKLTEQLYVFSGRKPQQAESPLNLNQIISEMIQLFKSVFGEKIQFFLDLNPALSQVTICPILAEQLLMNLLLNARDAMPEGGSLTICTDNVLLPLDTLGTTSENKTKPYVMLSIFDTGVGMSDQITTKIFDPTFTTKKFGKVHGIGLSTVAAIVKRYKGHILVKSEVGQGSAFHIYLPV